MLNLRLLLRPILPIATVLMLWVTSAPEAQANNGTSTATVQKPAVETPATTNNPNKKQTKAAKKPSQKSVLDADMLEKPLSFFKNAFSAEDDDDSDLLSHSNAIMITIKALIASLLSTII